MIGAAILIIRFMTTKYGYFVGLFVNRHLFSYVLSDYTICIITMLYGILCLEAFYTEKFLNKMCMPVLYHIL